MANILTPFEAAIVLRCNETDANMLALLPGVDAYLKQATGRDWAKENPVPEEARNAARMLLVLWQENPAMQGSVPSQSFGLIACISQLAAMALNTSEIHGQNGARSCKLRTALAGDTVASVIGLVGVTGDQSAAFEDVISEDGYIQQISASDLSHAVFRVKLIPPGEL